MRQTRLGSVLHPARKTWLYIIKFVLLTSLFFALMPMPSGQAATETAQSTEIYMPDGQFKSHLVRVYVNKNLGDMVLTDICLKLHIPADAALQGASETIKRCKEKKGWHQPVAMDNNHAWEKPVQDTSIMQHGTLLLFNLKGYPIASYKTATRVIPALYWCTQNGTDNNKCRDYAFAEKEVYLANPIGAYLWAAGAVFVLAFLLALMARNVHGRAIDLLCDATGRLSLSRTQMALWTIAIGGIVTVFGLSQLNVPSIPGTLLALMGASLLTTGVSHAKSQNNNPGASGKKASKSKPTPHWYDLISDGSTNTLSLARAQMLFWTILTLGMFVSKSILDGVLWQVPVELVGLMGMSQLAYLAPKISAGTPISKT